MLLVYEATKNTLIELIPSKALAPSQPEWPGGPQPRGQPTDCQLQPRAIGGPSTYEPRLSFIGLRHGLRRAAPCRVWSGPVSGFVEFCFKFQKSSLRTS